MSPDHSAFVPVFRTRIPGHRSMSVMNPRSSFFGALGQSGEQASPFSRSRSTSGIDEETVLKTAAPRKGVQSAILWCSASFL